MGCCHWTMAIQLLEQMPQQRMETDLVAWTRGDDMGMAHRICGYSGLPSGKLTVCY